MCHFCRLRVEAAFHSTHPQPGAALTVTTLVSIDRLPLLEEFCAHWAGPVVAAGYLPLIFGQAGDHNDTLQSFEDMFERYAAL